MLKIVTRGKQQLPRLTVETNCHLLSDSNLPIMVLCHLYYVAFIQTIFVLQTPFSRIGQANNC